MSTNEKVVPRAPTHAMQLAAMEAGYGPGIASDVWQAMYDAAPASAGEGGVAPEVAVVEGMKQTFPELHEATLMLVCNFAVALADKLVRAQQKYGYSDGWRSPDWLDECRQHLVEHVAKGDPRDVAAYCAFLWYHGASTTPPPTDVRAVEALRTVDLAVEVLQDRERPAMAEDLEGARTVLASLYTHPTPQAAPQEPTIPPAPVSTVEAGAQGGEVVGSLTIQRWRGMDSALNFDFQAANDALPDGTYPLVRKSDYDALHAEVGRLQADVFALRDELEDWRKLRDAAEAARDAAVKLLREARTHIRHKTHCAIRTYREDGQCECAACQSADFIAKLDALLGEGGK